MSNYPRTDAARLKDVCHHMAMAEECTRMEYELNEAKARIKRLEEAGDALRQAALGCCDECMDHIGLHSVGWANAKEAKP